MTNDPRFMITFNAGYSSYSAFLLLYRKTGWFRTKWERVDSFETIEKAKDYYEKIKDLPEYLP